MSFDLVPTENAQTMLRAARSPSLMPEPGMFTGFASGGAATAMETFAKTARAIDLAGAVGPIVSDAITGGTADQDAYFREHDQIFGSAVDHWTPAPGSVGTAGRIVGSLLPTLASFAVSPLLPVMAATGEGEDLAKMPGVTAKQAGIAGAVQGTGMALGAYLPIFGPGLFGKMAVGATSNIAQGVATRAGTAKALEGTDAAKQFNPWDAEGMVIDALMGIGFGGVVHLGEVQAAKARADQLRGQEIDAGMRMDLETGRGLGHEHLTETEKAAILVANQAQHLENSTAPGIPKTAADLTAHVDGMKKAIGDILADHGAEVGQDLAGARFTPSDQKIQDQADIQAEMGKQARATVDEAVPGRERAADLPPEERAIESAYFNRIDTEGLGALVNEYFNKFGRVINTDNARELSPEYAATKESRSRLAAAVHEPSSEVAKAAYREALASPVQEGKDPVVLFTAGGTGAGKSVGTAGYEKTADIIYDGNMNSTASAIKKIDQALDSGREVRIVYVHRDPIEALVNGALPRAMRMGRSVPITSHVETHVGASKTIFDIAEHYKDKATVTIDVVDNTHGRNGARLADLEVIKKTDYNNLHERLTEAAKTEFEAGRINEAVYEGTVRSPTVAGESGGARAAQSEQSAGSGRGVRKPHLVDDATEQLIADQGKPVDSVLDAEKALSDGDRVFRGNESDDAGRIEEVHSIEDLKGYPADQLVTLSRFARATDEATGLPLNDDGTVTVYHHTTADKAAEIAKTGKLKSAGEPDVYFTTRAEADTGYGDTAVPIRIDPAKLRLDDEFPDGRKDFSVDTGKPGGKLAVKVDPDFMAQKEAAPVDPIVTEAQAQLAKYPDLKMQVGTDAEGKPIMASLGDELRKASADYARAEAEAPGLFQTAAACMLGAM